ALDLGHHVILEKSEGDSALLVMDAGPPVQGLEQGLGEDGVAQSSSVIFGASLWMTRARAEDLPYPLSLCGLEAGVVVELFATHQRLARKAGVENDENLAAAACEAAPAQLGKGEESARITRPSPRRDEKA